MKRTLRNEFGVGFVLFVMAVLMLSCADRLAHGATRELPQVVREVVIQSDPNAALVGSIAGGQLVSDESEEHIATALRVTPVGMKLFDVGIAFCGNVGAQVTEQDGSKFLRGDVVFTYRRASPRLIDGVPCFDLVSVQPLPRSKQ